MIRLMLNVLGSFFLVLNFGFASNSLGSEEEPMTNASLAAIPSTRADNDGELVHELQSGESAFSVDNGVIEQFLAKGDQAVEPVSVNALPLMPKAVAEIYNIYDARRISLGSAWDMDVHGFNRKVQFGTLVPTLISHDTFSNKNLAFSVIKAEMLASALLADTDQSLKENVRVGLATLENYLHRSPIEMRETKCNVQHLFSRLWSLALQDQTLLYKLLLILGDNHATGGGCYPGHAGRFADLYLVTLRGFWQE